MFPKTINSFNYILSVSTEIKWYSTMTSKI
nr:MAG TPA: hypothetical protein [Caudoviricetes sp.]